MLGLEAISLGWLLHHLLGVGVRTAKTLHLLEPLSLICKANPVHVDPKEVLKIQQ